MNNKVRHNSGYSLIELIVVIIIIGILSSVAVKSLRQSTDVARMDMTLKGLKDWTYAVSGDPTLISGGNRLDYGFVGDNGALPPSIYALYQNSMGWATWTGPYLDDDFNDGTTARSFDRDAWGALYVINGVEISSTGGGTTITRRTANNIDELLYNSVGLTILDLDRNPPGSVFKDSLRLIITYPSGTGTFATKTAIPQKDGSVAFDSIPIGLHNLKLIYLPSGHTLLRKVNVGPGTDYYAEWTYFANVWSAP